MINHIYVFVQQGHTLIANVHLIYSNAYRVGETNRLELLESNLEYQATGEYIIRPPQPPVFVFVIDVTSQCTKTGMLDVRKFFI